MSRAVHVSHPDGVVRGDIYLDGSKSISNRVLAIQSLTSGIFDISGLSTSQDSVALQRMLKSDEKELNAGHAGTSFRFMTALTAVGQVEKILTGSSRMLQRPIGPLVTALKELGAHITYLGESGYPPLHIKPTNRHQWKHRVQIKADVSSQYISALLMIGPVLPNGLEIELVGKLVSTPYVDMTIRMMSHFGAKVDWRENMIHVSPGGYQPKAIKIEADWSAASYYFAIAALSKEAHLRLHGLDEKSLQGDQAIIDLMQTYGVHSLFSDGVWTLTRAPASKQTNLINFEAYPDIAQTIAVTSAALCISTQMEGLQTLLIKETDRIAALQSELEKIGCTLKNISAKDIDPGYARYQIDGKPGWSKPPVFKTYQDHRMAMAFAPLALVRPIVVEEPDVVRKSYPNFWNDLKKIGFRIREIES